MNVNENLSKLNPTRIQRFSSILRILFFVAATFSAIGGVLIIFWGIHSHFRNGHVLIFNGCITVTWSVLLWLACRLFQLYASGNLFNSKITSSIRQIGYISVLLAVERFLTTAFLITTSGSPKLTLAAISLELLVNISPGFAIICIAWIMDEGRKIQEEQELTV